MMSSGIKHWLIALMSASVVLFILCLTSCAGTNEAAKESHEYADAEFRQKFIEDRKRCHSRGRTIIIIGDGPGLDRDGIPRGRVNYYCARAGGFE